MRGEWIEISKSPFTLTMTDGSLPMRGEWIEIHHGGERHHAVPSLPMRGEWIEILNATVYLFLEPSLPMRGEWIEMNCSAVRVPMLSVSPHAGRVD